MVYRDRLTYLSERFILAQGEALRGYRAHYAGVRSEPAVKMPLDRLTLLSHGSFWELPRVVAFKVAGVVPRAFLRLRALDPALVHAHFGPDGVRAIPLARALSAPLVVSFHGFDATMHDEALRAMPMPSARQYPARRPLLQRSAACFIAVSEFVRQRLLAQGFPEGRVVVRYIGVDVDAFAPNGSERESIVLFVGRVVEQKGIDDFVRALAEIQRTGSAVRGVVVGDGPHAAAAAKLARDLHARIEFTGAQNQDAVRSWMRRSAVFCVPSRRMNTGAEEGFGLVFAEAQAAGLPVVSYSNGGIPEAVAHGETGLLCADGDWRQLAANLATLLEDAALRQSFGDAGRARTRRVFELRGCTAALESTYDDVVGEFRERVSNA